MSVSVVISPSKNPKKKYTAVFSRDGKKNKNYSLWIFRNE